MKGMISSGLLVHRARAKVRWTMSVSAVGVGLLEVERMQRRRNAGGTRALRCSSGP